MRDKLKTPNSLFFTFLIFIFLIGCTSNFKIDQPVDNVKLYFSAWDKQDYQTMYSLISDGFKIIEPTAQTLNNFEDYAKSQKIRGINIKNIQQTSNDSINSIVKYEVEFILDNKKIPFNGEFTLKYKSGDSVPGWKLIHPYGNNIDTT